MKLPTVGVLSLLALAACSGTTGTSTPSAAKPGANAAAADPHAEFGPLEVGADYQNYRKVSKAPFYSKTHGNRFVEVYVNETGSAAYIGNDEFPVGSIIVKNSWERNGDKPSQTVGPVFVMEKRAPGFDDAHENWWYAIHWENPASPWREKLGGPVYWRSPSLKVKYCWDCHENYDREIGKPPAEMRAW